MEKRQLGQSGLEVTVLTFGCWQAGNRQWTGTNDTDSAAAMRAAYDEGINFFDTAEGYGDGHSEQIVGQALGDVRDKIYIATKLGAGNMAPDKVAAACEGSLRRLGTDVIDLYQIHWPSGTWGGPLVPIGDTMAALVKLQEQGKVRALGVSNFDATQIEAALEVGRIDCLQPPYSLFFQPYVQNGTIEFCRQHNIGVICYSALAQGLVTGKFNLSNRPTDNRSGNHLFQDPTYQIALDAVAALQPLAAKYNCTTGQLAVAWLVAQPGVTSAIVGVRNPAQIEENIASASLKISASDLAAIGQLAQPVLASLPQNQTNPWG